MRFKQYLNEHVVVEQDNINYPDVENIHLEGNNYEIYTDIDYRIQGAGFDIVIENANANSHVTLRYWFGEAEVTKRGDVSRGDRDTPEFREPDEHEFHGYGNIEVKDQRMGDDKGVNMTLIRAANFIKKQLQTENYNPNTPHFVDNIKSLFSEVLNKIDK